MLYSRRACGNLEYSTLRDSMRADAYAGGRIKNFRSHSLTYVLTQLYLGTD